MDEAASLVYAQHPKNQASKAVLYSAVVVQQSSYASGFLVFGTSASAFFGSIIRLTDCMLGENKTGMTQRVCKITT